MYVLLYIICIYGVFLDSLFIMVREHDVDYCSTCGTIHFKCSLLYSHDVLEYCDGSR